MIFYFSGTGNSLYVAKTLGKALDERMIDMAEELKKPNHTFHYTLEKGEKLGFVFPVYAWAPPEAVVSFLKKMECKTKEENYCFAVCTCGNSAGETINIFQKELAKKKMRLDSGFSIVMPDNYVVGFDVDDREQEQQKLDDADIILKKIIQVTEKERKGFFRVHKGKLPVLKSGIVSMLFHTFGQDTKPFYATGECIGCGLCVEVCTSGCIHLKEDKPVWDKGTCNMCMACLNRCPKSAIQYGKKTESRGRYVNPHL